MKSLAEILLPPELFNMFDRKFYLHIKSHIEMPDYEDSCIASNKQEAAQIFYNHMSWEGRADWSVDHLLEHIYTDGN